MPGEGDFIDGPLGEVPHARHLTGLRSPDSLPSRIALDRSGIALPEGGGAATAARSRFLTGAGVSEAMLPTAAGTAAAPGVDSPNGIAALQGPIFRGIPLILGDRYDRIV